MFVLITYDIANTKRRTNLSTLLEGYGLRVNFSVFELDIKKKALDMLILQMTALCGKHDSVRVYRFSQDTIAQSFELNAGVKPFTKESAYVD